MEPISVIAAITAIIGLLTTGGLLGKRIYDKGKKRIEDNRRITTIDGIKDLLVDAKGIWDEEGGEIRDFISQVMAASKAIDKQTTAVDRIEENKKLRDVLFKAAAEIGPESVDQLAEVLTPVPKDMIIYGGSNLDKLTKIKEAQRKTLSDKEAMNEILANSGEMAKKMAGALKALAELQK